MVEGRANGCYVTQQQSAIRQVEGLGQHNQGQSNDGAVAQVV